MAAVGVGVGVDDSSGTAMRAEMGELPSGLPVYSGMAEEGGGNIRQYHGNAAEQAARSTDNAEINHHEKEAETEAAEDESTVYAHLTRPSHSTPETHGGPQSYLCNVSMVLATHVPLQPSLLSGCSAAQ